MGCLFIFKGHIAGYVTAKKEETGILNIKNGETFSFYRHYFFRNSNNF